jgi:hypothetical protein
MDEQFSAYEVPADEGYEDEGYEADEGLGDEGYHTDDVLEELGVIDEYGQVDEGRLAAVVEGMHRVHQDQVGLAQAQTEHGMDQTAQDLENQYPQLRDEAFTMAMLSTAAEMLGYEGDPQDLVEYTCANPEIVHDAVEHMNGEGIFQRMWEEQRRDPGVAFFTGGGGSGGSFAGM